ncbi:MAG: hypothetical protein ACM3PO_08565 [Betaproteobacteria bacterium]
MSAKLDTIGVQHRAAATEVGSRGIQKSRRTVLNLNTVMQIGLVAFTALGFLFTSMKLPHYGVAANLVGQIFWLYSSYRAWREADQIGIFILTIGITLILLYGVANYWL